MAKYVMGIDHGGTSSKAVLFDRKGTEIASAHCSTPMLMPKPGFTERDMDALWEANCEVIRRTIEKSGIDPADIVGVSFSGHGKGLYLWGKDDRPVRAGIVSTDSRAHEIVRRWTEDGTATRVYERTFQSILASQPVALIRWLMENEPESIERTRYVFGVKDYLRYRMTGVARAEITDISGSNLVNLKTKQYDSALLEWLGIQPIEEKLPPLIGSSEICGTVTESCARQTGLAVGTPVAAGLFDIDACAIGMNIVDGDRIAMIAGTWAINEYISTEPVVGGKVKMNSLYCLPDYYLAEECSPTSASNYDWFLNNFSDVPGDERYAWGNAQVDSVPPDAQEIVFLPYLFGGCDNPKDQGAFLGLESWHTRAHMMRAVCEGIVFSHRRQVERLQRSRKTPARRVRLAGGVVRSSGWVQMFSDILKMPVETVEAEELGALGAAMTAAVAAGEYADLKTAASNMVHMGKVYFPDEGRAEVYDRKYERYVRAEKAAGQIFTGEEQ